MSNKLNKIEDIYESLFEISKQIGELLDRNLYAELVIYFNKKENLLKQSSELIKQLGDVSKINTSKLKHIAQKYAEQEKKNLSKMQNIKDEIKKDISKTNKDKKLLNAYNQNKEHIYGNILEFWE